MLHATDSVDFVEELRLRRWARENYCYAEVRLDSWHPIIHDEMQQRDREEVTAGDQCKLTDQVTSLPADFAIPAGRADAAAMLPRTTVADMPGLPIGRIVPLAPDQHGPHEIMPPHARIEAPACAPEMHYT